MKRNTFFRTDRILFLLLLCSVLILPSDICATSTDTEPAPIELSEEEKAYRDRSDEITIGCPIQGCPLLFQDEETGQLEGITIEVLDMISAETGLTFRYQVLPAGNITYEDLRQLDIDMVAGVESNEINKNSPGIAMTDTYLHAEKVFVCRKGEVFQPDSKMTIAVDSGSQTLEKVLRQQYPMFQILFCDSTEDALSALLSGEADAVLQNQYTIERILGKPIYEDLQIVAAASIGDSQCLASLVPVNEDKEGTLSGDVSLLLSIINKGIARLDQNEISFLIIKETAENAYRLTLWDMMYRYRFAITILFISLLLILILVRRNHLLHVKHTEQIAAAERANELAVINARMKEQQLLLMDSLNRAEEGNRTKTSFLFNMSHDIRTPMNAILGFTEIAKRNINDPAKMADSIEKIEVSGKHLLHLINNVLDMAKIENGKVALTENCCDLEECIEKVRDILQTEIDKKQLAFRIDLSAVKNKWVYCDNIRINQILFNLLHNAVKFSKPGGSILVTLSQNTCKIREYGAYEIHVKDTGIGMPPEFLSHIFEPFEREHTSTVSRTQGVGLGMPITKNLIDLMGGTIEVFSERGKGTEFVLRFTFKMQEQEKEQEQTEQPPSIEAASAYDFSGKRLLLVEDNELNMEIAEELLCEVGFLVETAQNGQIAVEMVQNSTAGYYDVILMDIQMPVMNGYQASREIRRLEDKELAGIPIIALTANAFDDDKKEALSSGMNDHIAKPINVEELYEVLENVLRESEFLGTEGD